MSWLYDALAIFLKLLGVDWLLPGLQPPFPPSASRCFFFDLPTDVHLDILHVWIAEPPEHDGPVPRRYLSRNSPHSRMLRTLSALDVACCNRSLRPHIISLIHSCHIAGTAAWDATQVTRRFHTRINFLCWAQSRQVVIDELYLDKQIQLWLARLASSNLHVQSTQTIRLNIGFELRGELPDAEIESSVFVVFPKCMSIQHNNWSFSTTNRYSWNQSNAWQITHRHCYDTELKLARANALKETTISLRYKNFQSLYLFPQHIQLGYLALAQCPQLTTLGFYGDWSNRQQDMHNLLDAGQHQLRTVKLLDLYNRNEWLCFAEMLETHPWIMRLELNQRTSWDRSMGHLVLFLLVQKTGGDASLAALKRILVAVRLHVISMVWNSYPPVVDWSHEPHVLKALSLVEHCLVSNKLLLREFSVQISQNCVTPQGDTQPESSFTRVNNLRLYLLPSDVVNGIHRIPQYYPNLLSLQFVHHRRWNDSNSFLITDAGLQALLLQCPRLTLLGLSAHCPHVTKQTLYTIAEHKLALTLLAIDGIAGFDHKDVREFKEYCRKQRVLPVPRICLKAHDKDCCKYSSACCSLLFDDGIFA